jgi:hypothetical protein
VVVAGAGGPGAAPFTCPLDHVLDLENMIKALPEEEFGPHIDFREHSFLAKPWARHLLGYALQSFAALVTLAYALQLHIRVLTISYQRLVHLFVSVIFIS